MLPGTLCTGDVFGGFLEAGGVPMERRTVIELTSPRIEDHAARLAGAAEGGAIVCGFSLGAIVAAHLADRVDASLFVFFGLNPFPDDPAKREGRMTLVDDVERRGGAAALEGRMGSFAGPDPQAVRAMVLAMADAAAPHVTAQTRLALDRPGALRVLCKTRQPVIALTGTADTQAPLACARAVANAATRGCAVPLEGLGHYALLEDPALCWQAFLRGSREVGYE